MYIPTYDQIHYNQVILYLEEKWERKLNEHEVNVLLEGYRFGRYIEMENNYAMEAAKCYVPK